jgi:hypothetical protein
VDPVLYTYTAKQMCESPYELDSSDPEGGTLSEHNNKPSRFIKGKQLLVDFSYHFFFKNYSAQCI